MKCSEVMTKDPNCCLPTDTAVEAAQLMKSENVGPIPIVNNKDEKKLEGIVTDRDLVVNLVAEGRDPRDTRVSDVMTTSIKTCRADDDVKDAIELMEEHQIRRIPIVDENDRLLGIIAQADIATRMQSPGTTAEVVKQISQSA
jgi:CBS domain-containing protein